MTSLSMWTLYDHPSDYPEGYIARMWIVDENGPRPTSNVIIAKDPATIREVLMTHLGKVKLDRYEADDPVIMEVWI